MERQIKTFANYREARKQSEEMKGWDAKVTQLYLPDDQHANLSGNVWVIQCDGNKYLRIDDYVN